MLKVLILSILLSAVSWLVAETPAKTAEKTTTSKPLPIMRSVGGDFTAVGVDGKPFQLNRYHDKIVLLFFGYTNCADICPFTLGYLKGLYEKFFLTRTLLLSQARELRLMRLLNNITPLITKSAAAVRLKPKKCGG